MEINSFFIKGIKAEYEGNLSYLDKSVYFCFSGPLSDDMRKKARLSLIEAAANGYSVVLSGFSKVFYDALELVLKCRLSVYVVLPEKRSLFSIRGRYRNVLLSGGAYIFPQFAENDNGKRKRMCSFFSSSISSAILFLNYADYTLASAALDEGRPIAVMRESLVRASARSLVYQGCPVVESFSSFLCLPSCYAVALENGRDFKVYYF
ncbi:MAG TPA: hypothetical protein IAB12_00165 [Candidatus Ornithospirochaeta avicola]|uniref:Uncharacterized protein n=1 Tax=Candidatus Ornithospirochaeta avicola TaxID=2840896 RepID=A0A9D1TM73_9SPIO|nr:hypothetical protein [Candidatus Ornithospirochaeta avicola]